MSNFHSDEWIMEKLNEHYNEALQYFPEERIVGIFLQGSQNYGLDHEDSDIDTKLIVVPSFHDIALAKQPISTTHVRANDEHIDFKDVRLYIQIFRKQNLNFMEILYTKYYIINPKYLEQWKRLLEMREEICRYNPVQAIKSMRGIAKEKYFALEHRYPSRAEWLDKYAYDPKQLHHLLRVKEYIIRYINGEPYGDCLQPNNGDYLVRVKTGEEYGADLETVRKLAKDTIDEIDAVCEEFLALQHTINTEIDELFNDVQYEIMKIAIRTELS